MESVGPIPIHPHPHPCPEEEEGSVQVLGKSHHPGFPKHWYCSSQARETHRCPAWWSHSSAGGLGTPWCSREEGALPIPASKVAAASGLNGFDYLIRLWFNGLDNMLIHYEGCSKMF